MMGSGDFGRYGQAGRSRPFNLGVALIGLGVLFLLWRLLAPTGALPLLILGSIFTGLALFGRARGFVVPGGILLGLASGLIAAALLRHVGGAYGGAAIVGGLGAGFWSIPLLDRVRHPYESAFGWARIPGSILLGIAAFLGLVGTIGALFHYWPIVLIVGMPLLFFGRRRRSRSRWS